NGDWVGVYIAPGMMVYYGAATENGIDISDKLNGRNSGRFCWVSNYNCGFYSSTNVIYANGTTNRVNRPRAQECLSVGTPIDTCIPSPTPCACNPPIVTFPLDGSGTNNSGGGNGGGGNGGGGTSGSALPTPGFPAAAGIGGSMFGSAAYNGLFYET